MPGKYRLKVQTPGNSLDGPQNGSRQKTGQIRPIKEGLPARSAYRKDRKPAAGTPAGPQAAGNDPGLQTIVRRSGGRETAMTDARRRQDLEQISGSGRS